MKERALIYNGALSTYGGGERYTFALADVLSENYEVVLAAQRLPDVLELERRGFPPGYEMRSISPGDFTASTRGYDLVIRNRFAPPLQPSRANRSVVVVQFPSSGLAPIHRFRAHLRQRRAMQTFGTYVTYSTFCARFVADRWGVQSHVVHPPAALGQNSESKEPGIISIARFEATKQHPVLIEAYKSLPRELRNQYPLHLVGGVGRGASSQAYLAELRRSAQGQNIVFHPNASEASLQALLRRLTLFWHAKGYARPKSRPDLAEHFGIVAVEAMSHGLVPLVIDDGGLPEIVDAGCGVLWRSIDELVTATCRLVEDETHRTTLARAAANRSHAFSREAFERRIRGLLL